MLHYYGRYLGILADGIVHDGVSCWAVVACLSRKSFDEHVPLHVCGIEEYVLGVGVVAHVVVVIGIIDIVYRYRNRCVARCCRRQLWQGYSVACSWLYVDILNLQCYSLPVYVDVCIEACYRFSTEVLYFCA